MTAPKSIQTISVIVPRNPFVPTNLQGIHHCVTALSVQKLMEWWPGTPHTPHRDATKVQAIQRSLDWRRVAQIAAYLLQDEIVDVPAKIDQYFRRIYEPKKGDPGREWPPRVPRVIGFERSDFPTFANVLIHVNGAKVNRLTVSGPGAAAVERPDGAAALEFDENDPNLNFSVIDGQHRINGAFLAVSLLRRRKDKTDAIWEIPAEVFIDLDKKGEAPRRQAQIFIDVNFYQRKVDRSLVADLFPTARGPRDPLDNKERSQDLGRKLMLEVGPLVGMIQIPGIRYGVRDVVTLATLASAIEEVLDEIRSVGIESLEGQAEFLAQCLTSWLEASGRKEEIASDTRLDPENVAYQGRVIVSFLTLIPACIWKLRQLKQPLVSPESQEALTEWLHKIMDRAGMIDRGGKFLPRSKFRDKGFLGSGGLARFRDTLWIAAMSTGRRIPRLSAIALETMANGYRGKVARELPR